MKARPRIPVAAAFRGADSSTAVVIGLVAGLGVGLFIGERAAVFQIAADAYIKLLQMTVLPYITLSLVGGLGALRKADVARLGVRAGLVLLTLWAIALVAVFTFPAMFPHIQAASFFSTTLLEEHSPLDLVGLYIPANPFNSLANNIVPAVVLFSALLGVALIGIPGKERALEAIDVLNRAVGRVARFIVALTPFGLFAIAAVTAGTFDPHEAQQLQMYLVAYVAVSLLLSLWVLPALVAALTPVPHRELLARTRTALLMAFTTGSLFVVLPLLTEQTRQLLRDHAPVTPADERLADVIIPASFNFPHTAKLLSLSFVLFAAWFTGTTILPARYPALAMTGVLVLFGNLNVAIPFLLDMFRIPADTFQLFLASSVVNARFGTLLSAVHTLAMGVVGTCAVVGAVRLDARKLLRFATMTVLLGTAVIGGTRLVVTRYISRPYDQDKVLTAMQALRDRGNARVYRSPAPPLGPYSGSLLDRIRSRGVLRVGYVEGSLPYVFTNARGDLVGFDVEMALQLGRDLGLEVELVPVPRDVLEHELDPSLCDLVMSGTAVTAPRAVNVLFSTSYLDETLAFLVPDYRRNEFSSWDDIRALHGLRIGAPRLPYYLRKIAAELPAAEIVTVDNPNELFERRNPPLEALAITAERGSAYTLLHPEYSVVVPKPGIVKVPLGYVIAGRDLRLAHVVDTWIDLKRKDGTIDELFAHWILGRDATPHRRRWSVVDDVLHWGRQ
jgi:Na+/H+-dicarboxylate symporter/ABC-type amino acid transport substrate-binding protein